MLFFHLLEGPFILPWDPVFHSASCTTWIAEPQYNQVGHVRILSLSRSIYNILSLMKLPKHTISKKKRAAHCGAMSLGWVRLGDAEQL